MFNPAAFAENGWLPDPLVRWGIRQRLAARLSDELEGGVEGRHERLNTRLEDWHAGPIATASSESREQHYEVPTEFFERILGPRMKYSACWWPEGVTDIEAAETVSLEQVVTRAQVKDGMRCLELGCGWGSLSLFLAERFPASSITAVSNSATQREFILDKARQRGLENVSVVTSDINEFDTDEKYDRVLSIEMFEHVRNHPLLLRSVRRWLVDDGRLFIHIFCHREFAFPYEANPADWMASHFFTGGIMPSEDLIPSCGEEFQEQSRWRNNGRHYMQTLEAWLAAMDADKAAIMPIMENTYGEANATLWWNRWRIFLMACSELFGYESGNEWYVAHYLLRPRDAVPKTA